MQKRARIKISGEVQGVFFRVKTQEKAEELGLSGWVKNEADGTVKILTEGEPERLEELIKYCQSGHKFAKVERVDVKWEQASGEFKGFDIKYNKGY